MGKTFYVKELRGQLYACKWPKKRPRPTHPTTIEQMEKFRQANWATKYAPATIQMFYTKMVEGTSLLPRDLMVAAMYGRGFTWQNPNQRRRYPVAALRDLSDTLDILGSELGDTLARGPDRWYSIRPTAAGQILTSPGPDQLPTWQTWAGGGGLWSLLNDFTTVALTPQGTFLQTTIPANCQEVDFTWAIPALAAGNDPDIRVNGLATAIYGFVNNQVSSGVANIVARATGNTRVRCFHQTLQPNTFACFINGRAFQRAAGQPIGIEGNAWTRNATGGTFHGHVDVAAGVRMTSIDFGSPNFGGMPAGTRIIVRGDVR